MEPGQAIFPHSSLLLMGIAKNLIGRVFNRLTVIERTENRGPNAAWRCSCSCGSETVATTGTLMAGKVGSCGCYGKERVREATTLKLIGRRFGRLTVISRRDELVRQSAMWNCVCDCGNEKAASSHALNHHRVISCGCAAIDKPGLRPKDVRNQWAVYGINRRALKSDAGGTFTLEQIEDLYRKQRGKCACCTVKLGDAFHRDHKIPLSAGGSNDITNIELLCGPCNLAKSDKDPIAWANENGLLI